MAEADFDMGLIISRLRDRDPEIQRTALHALHNEVKDTQGTIAVRTQEFLDVQSSIAECLDFMEEGNRRHLCDLLSVMNVLEDGQACLRYRLAGNVTSLFEWTHQYVKKLIKCILDIVSSEETAEDYEILVEPITEFLVRHNSEVEAIDFIIEVSHVRAATSLDASFFAKAISFINAPEVSVATEPPEDAGAKKTDSGVIRKTDVRPLCMHYFDFLLEMVDNDNRSRVLVYLEEISEFYDIEEVLARANAFEPSRCLVTLIRYGRTSEAIEYVRGMEDPAMKKQLLYILARNSIYYEGDKEGEYILSNKHLGDVFMKVAGSLEVLPPKKLEYMFKGLNKDRIDVSAIANALVHCAYGRDPVFFPQEGDFKIKEEYAEQLKIYKSLSTMASVGLIHSFNPQGVYDFYSLQIFNEPEIGAVLALALSSSRMRDSDGSILNLLSIFLESADSRDIIAALMGISILYSGHAEQEVYNLVFPLLSSADGNVSLFAIYTLGSVFTGDMDILSSCLDVYEELQKELPFSNFALLGIAMFFYKMPLPVTEYDLEDHSKGTSSTDDLDGDAAPDNEPAYFARQENYTSAAEDVSSTPAIRQFRRLDKHTKLLSLGLMHIGSGNPSVIDHIFSKALIGEIDALLESLGLLSCCLIGIGDGLATRLIDRITTSSLLLDSSHLRSIVPLCIGLLYASNPHPEVLDVLEKCINSGEANVNSLLGLGIVGAGTCSSRILRILDANFGNVYKDTRASSALIFAQGLVSLGKGLFTLSPMAYDSKVLLSRSALSLVSTLFLFLESGMFKEYPFLLYLLTPAISPKYVAGYEGIVRVGKPVDTVGVVGHPNRISAAIVHSLPIILNGGEKAETEDAICTAFVEDILVKK